MVDASEIRVIEVSTLNPVGTGVTAGQWNTIRGDVDALIAGDKVYYPGNYADDLQDTIDAAATAGGGLVQLEKGSYPGPFTWKTGVWIRGAGRDVTELTIPNATDDAVLKSEGFDALMATDSTGGIHSCGISDLTINGNAAGQTGSSPGPGEFGTVNGLSIYGYDYEIDNVTIYNAADNCFYSEWGTSLDPPGPNGMEARIRGLRLHDAGIYTFVFNGPHDSQISDIEAYNNNDGIFIAGKASGSQLARIHSYGDQPYAIYIDAGVTIADLIAEGASLANIFLAANDVILDPFRAFGAGAADPVGIEFVESASGYLLIGRIDDCTDGAFKYTSAGGNGIIIVLCRAASGAAEVGTPPASDKVIIPVSGGMTGARFSFT